MSSDTITIGGETYAIHDWHFKKGMDTYADPGDEALDHEHNGDDAGKVVLHRLEGGEVVGRAVVTFETVNAGGISDAVAGMIADAVEAGDE